VRILVIEDESRLARAIGRGLTEHGFEVAVAHDGDTGYRLAQDADLDLIVLDLMLPGLPGDEVCRRLRSRGVWTPILVLTAKDTEDDETTVLELGADDYMRKPFSFAVLVARSRALIRRGPLGEPSPLAVGDLLLDPARRTVRRGDAPIALTRREFALLEYLMRHAGEVRSKEEILQALWGEAGARDPNVVEVYIGYLRRKVDQPFAASSLSTVRGRGYRLEAAR
jgi:two-component system, OmpR family, response regulator